MAKNTRWFLTSIVLFGAYALLAQVILLRELLVVFYGNEICLGLIFSCWLFWISIGAWIARRISDLLDPGRSLTIWILSLALLPLFLPIQIYLIRVLREILNISTGEWIPFFPMVLSVLCILIPISFIIGFSFPAACRVLPPEGTGAVSIVRVYINEDLGSIVVGVAFTFFLVDRMNPFSISALGGSVLILTILPLSGSLSTRQRYRIVPMLFLILFSQVSLLSYGPSLQKYSVQKRWASFKLQEELKISVDSRYQNIAVGYEKGQYSVYGNGLWAYSFPDEYSFAALAHLALSEHPNPKSVLLIGGGEGGLIREVLKHPVQQLSYVELDPALIQTVGRFLSDEDRKALNDSRVTLHAQDGRYFVKHSDIQYDAVLINLPDPGTAMLNRYYTLDFFEEVKRVLRPGGMVFLSLTSTGNFAGEDIVSYGRSVYRTLKKAFPYVVVAPGPPQSFFASSSPNVVTSDPEVLSHRYLEREVNSEVFSHLLFEQIFPQERVRSLKSVLEKKGKERLNTDLHPVSYFYNLILWGRSSGSSLAGLLGFLKQVPRIWFYSPLLLALTFIVLVRKREQVRSSALFAISTTGLYGLSLEIILLFLFQNLYGYVYQKIGLMVALFMFGLALGGALANRILKGVHKNVPGLLLWSEGTILFFALLTPWLSRIAGLTGVPVEWMIYCMMIIIGITAGFQFPMVSEICIADGMGQAKAASSIDSRDHSGACIGALLTGILFVPLLGISGSCYLVGGIKGVSLTRLIIRKKTGK
jgi:spermidine synthase